MIVPERTLLIEGVVVVGLVDPGRRAGQEALRAAAMTHQPTHAFAVGGEVGLEVGGPGAGEVEDVVEVLGQLREVPGA